MVKVSIMRIHRMEFWPYMNGNEPRDVHIEALRRLVHLERDLSGIDTTGFEVSEYSIPDRIREDVEDVWEAGRAENPRLTNNPKPVIKIISPDGRLCTTWAATYKTSYWLKTRLSEQPPEDQELYAHLFPFFNIGTVTLTSDGYIALEQRPEGVTAPGMLLTYPCGYVETHHTTLAETMNDEAEGELGFPLLDAAGEPLLHTQALYTLGFQRESDEWNPNYVFVLGLTHPSTHLRPTRETRKISYLPDDPAKLAEAIPDLYSPSIKGEVRGKLVPNATAMLALYIREREGERAFGNLMDRLSHEAKKEGYQLEVRNYTPATNPFQ